MLPSLVKPNAWFWHYAGIYSVIVACAFVSFWLSIFWISALSRIFAYTALPVIVLVQLFFRVSMLIYGPDSTELTTALYNTTWKEAEYYVTVENVGAILFAIVLVYFFIFILRKILNPQQFGRKSKIGITVLSVCVFFVTFLAYILHMATATGKREDCEWIQKIRCYHPTCDVICSIMSIYHFTHVSYTEDPTEYDSTLVSEYQPNAVLLYIGESYRADHSPLNGYSRNTMPYISKEKNIINLPQIRSKGTSTLSSIQSLLSITKENSIVPTHKSFIKVLLKHGYSSAMMVGANTNGFWYQSPHIAAILDNSVSLYSNPRNPAEYSKDVKTLIEKNRPVFILIEDGAGHIPYDAENATFGNGCDIDKYDNSLIDVDARLIAIIDQLKEKDAILFFISDHGESFGEEGRYCHSGPLSADEQVHVCCFIWYSNLYERRRPNIVEALKQNATRKVNHSFIYHTIISASGIHSKVQNCNLDFTHPSNKSE